MVGAFLPAVELLSTETAMECSRIKLRIWSLPGLQDISHVGVLRISMAVMDLSNMRQKMVFSIEYCTISLCLATAYKEAMFTHMWCIYYASFAEQALCPFKGFEAHTTDPVIWFEVHGFLVAFPFIVGFENWRSPTLANSTVISRRR
jgi:hypothetical protein